MITNYHQLYHIRLENHGKNLQLFKFFPLFSSCFPTRPPLCSSSNRFACCTAAQLRAARNSCAVETPSSGVQKPRGAGEESGEESGEARFQRAGKYTYNHIYIYILYDVCVFISIYIYTHLYVHIYIYTMKIVRELNKSDMGIY